jgi:hypothetical protein
MEPIDAYRAANLLIQQHGADAIVLAAERLVELREAGDEAGAVIWQKIALAINALMRDNPSLDRSAIN